MGCKQSLARFPGRSASTAQLRGESCGAVDPPPRHHLQGQRLSLPDPWRILAQTTSQVSPRRETPQLGQPTVDNAGRCCKLLLGSSAKGTRQTATSDTRRITRALAAAQSFFALCKDHDDTENDRPELSQAFLDRLGRELCCSHPCSSRGVETYLIMIGIASRNTRWAARATHTYPQNMSTII